MGLRPILLCVMLGWAAPLDVGAAEQVLADRPDFALTLGVREWVSQGRSAHHFGAPDGNPNVLSELTWRGLNSLVTEFRADLVVDRLVGHLALGFGGIGSGTFRDQDWNANNRTDKEVETLSSVRDSSVFYVSVTPGLRLVRLAAPGNPIPGGIDLLIGYQYWRERYQAFGGQQLFPTNVPLGIGLGLTQTNTWHSVRVGIGATIPVLSFIAVKGSAFYIPVTYYHNEDVHHVRTDLRQDPSFLTTASGGQGVQLEAALVLRPWRRLLVEAGYRYWDMRSGTGVVEAFRADGIVVREPFTVENTRRQGIFFGVSWMF